MKDEYSSVFGNKYVPFMSPESPSAERLSPGRQCNLAELNPRMPRFADDVARVGEPVDSALTVAIGFGHTATDPVQRAGPYLIRGAADLVPTTALLDDYRGMIPCTVRNCHGVGPRIASSLGGGNGYPLAAFGTLTGAGNPYVYPRQLAADQRPTW